jgi:hypothetical protein
VQKAELPAVSTQSHSSKLPPEGGRQTSFVQAKLQQRRQGPPPDWHSAQVLLLVSQIPVQQSPSPEQGPPFDTHSATQAQLAGSKICPWGQPVETQRPPQRVLPSGQPQTLSSPRLTQFLEQHWRSLRHLRPKPLQSSSAQAAPGTKEASALPTSPPPSNLNALPLERVPLASPLASSSKELSVDSLAIGCPLSRK